MGAVDRRHRHLCRPDRVGHPVDQGRATSPATLYETSEKKAIFGALRLYLDFINLFQQLLFLMGNRRS